MCFGGVAYANEALLARFFPAAGNPQRHVARPLVGLPEVDRSESPVEQYNAGVKLNNDALEAMRGKNFKEACRLLKEACQLVPAHKGFLNNYLIALQQVKGQESETIRVAHTIMALDASDSQAPLTVGLMYLNELKQPAKAIDYLAHALQLAPENSSIATSLAIAYEKAGFAEDAFEVLKKYAARAGNEAYPFYLLGLQYLERRDYNPAIRAFESARKLDEKGYAHDAWVRARYFAGQLEGLGAECRAILQRFPGVLNRESLEKILISLQPGDFRLVETIGLKISTPSALDKLDFLIKPVPDVANHQSASLVSAEFSSRGRQVRANIDAREGNKLRIGVPAEVLAPDLQLKLTYHIVTTPFLGSQIVSTAGIQEPDIRLLANDPLFSIDNPLLASLVALIDSRPGNFVQNATLAVANGLKYRENYEDHPVEWAFANPDACDCTEFARLLAAICLKKGIPARVATGFLIKNELLGRETSVGHAWCEVFFKGKGWVPVDPTLQSTMHWAYFGNLLSDQILFDFIGAEKRSRVSIDFSSSRPDLKVSLSNSYLISKW